MYKNRTVNSPGKALKQRLKLLPGMHQNVGINVGDHKWFSAGKEKQSQRKLVATRHKTITQLGTINRGRQLGNTILRSSSTHRKA